MKIRVLIASLVIASGLFAAGTKTVNYVLKTAKDNESVILEGTFISQIDNDEFIFQDKTGKVKVDISKKNTDIQPAVSTIARLDGAKVKIKGVVDKEMFEKTEVKALRIKVIQLAKDDFADEADTVKTDKEDF